MKKSTPLEVGQRIWIESYPVFRQGESRINEFEIVETNKSSAYAVHVEDMDKNKAYPRRIEQRTKKVIERYSAGYGFKMWYSEEDYLKSKRDLEMKSSLKKLAIKKVEGMNLSELQAFVNQNN